MQRTTSYKRPTAQRGQRKVAPTHTPDRFEREVLGGRLWHPACQQAAGDISEEIPLQFASVDDYLGVLDPLVLEEAREGLKADWAESCAAGKLWEVEVVHIEELEDGWTNLKLRAYSGHGALRQACPNNTSLVLSFGRPPARGADQWSLSQVKPPSERPAKRQRLNPTASSASIAGTADDSEASDLDQRQPRAAAAPREAGSRMNGMAARGAGDHAGAAGADADWIPGILAGIARRSKDAELLVQVYPRCAVHAQAGGDCCCGAVLRLLRSKPLRWWLVPAKHLVSNQREYEALHHVRHLDSGLMRPILRPQLLSEAGSRFEDPVVRQRMWPPEAAHPGFIGYLQKQYDHTQLEAIEMAACHLGARHEDQASLPFILIQGPPGTGKTHTVKGILNVWNLVAYQRYYDGLIRHALPQARASSGGGGGGGPGGKSAEALKQRSQQLFLEKLQDSRSSAVEAVESLYEAGSLGQAVASTKPRILVCTPSNAACDELMRRIMENRFCDNSGNLYRPNVVRVGSEQVSPAVRERWVGQMVDAYEAMEQGTWQHRYGELNHKIAHCQREIDALELSLPRVSSEQQQIELAKRLVERHQQQYRYGRDLDRLEMARDVVWGQREEWRLREARRNIEASFLTEAEMVFTTLSSTGRQAFQQAAQKVPFKTVLIDEAGQATEVASLQPLMHGAQRVVMVGDPQQLPATILSTLAKEAAMERSLFERLQRQGCPVKMLSVQYRMHPEIRQFPSEHFYGGRLLDAPSITSQPDEAFYEHAVLKPYVFFDVARGQEQRRLGGGSVSNKAEAELAACLFYELRSFLVSLAQQDPSKVPRPVTVGVITPYREQRKLLHDTFLRICGKQAAAEVFIETVDSFQGKQLDVVILSCVRAGSGGGLGFVTDIRRMNVAITRAKRALWVLGSIASLRANPEWAALIGDAEQRGVVIGEADARELFPDQEHWAKADAQASGAGQAKQASSDGEAAQQQQQQQQGQQAPKVVGATASPPEQQGLAAAGQAQAEGGAAATINASRMAAGQPVLHLGQPAGVADMAAAAAGALAAPPDPRRQPTPPPGTSVPAGGNTSLAQTAHLGAGSSALLPTDLRSATPPVGADVAQQLQQLVQQGVLVPPSLGGRQAAGQAFLAGQRAAFQAEPHAGGLAAAVGPAAPPAGVQQPQALPPHALQQLLAQQQQQQQCMQISVQSQQAQQAPQHPLHLALPPHEPLPPGFGGATPPQQQQQQQAAAQQPGGLYHPQPQHLVPAGPQGPPGLMQHSQAAAGGAPYQPLQPQHQRAQGAGQMLRGGGPHDIFLDHEGQRQTSSQQQQQHLLQQQQQARQAQQVHAGLVHHQVPQGLPPGFEGGPQQQSVQPLGQPGVVGAAAVATQALQQTATLPPHLQHAEQRGVQQVQPHQQQQQQQQQQPNQAPHAHGGDGGRAARGRGRGRTPGGAGRQDGRGGGRGRSRVRGGRGGGRHTSVGAGDEFLMGYSEKSAVTDGASSKFPALPTRR